MTDSKHKNGSPPSANDDLNRVREILFGADQRRTNEQLAALRKDFEKQLQVARADAARERQELRTELTKQLELLQSGKLDRDDLAAMFGNMVARLGPAMANPAGK